MKQEVRIRPLIRIVLSVTYAQIGSDITGDGFVDIFGMVIVFNNMQSGVGMNTPPNPMKKGK